MSRTKERNEDPNATDFFKLPESSRATRVPLGNHLKNDHPEERTRENYLLPTFTPLEIEVLDWIHVRTGGDWKEKAELVSIVLPHIDHRRLRSSLAGIKARHAALDMDKCTETMDAMVERFQQIGLVPTEEELHKLFFKRA